MFNRNTLFYGDNLVFLADPDVFPSESVDLIYLDPPFNSNASYNVLFKEATGEPSAAQIKAFDDTWKWDASAAEALHLLMNDKHTPGELAALINTFHQFLGHSPMLAYLVQMAVRLTHMHRVLKPTGSLYLHCDPTASHYLKLVLDAVFGSKQFRREIVWRSGWVSGFKTRAKNWVRNHDILLYYVKSSDFTFNKNLAYKPHPEGYERRGGGENPLGVAIDDVWDDVELYSPWIKSFSQEKLGYATQKPRTLLERIVAVSSNPGDVVLDPFCGCGTTIDAVETLNREHPDQPARIWLGIDITHLAVNLIKHRLARFDPPPVYDVRGEPVDVAGAEALFREDRFQFQFWACGLVAARPAGAKAGSKKGKKGADRGIDGVRYFTDDAKGAKAILVQVKGGKHGVHDIRDFRGTVEREGAAMGIFITLNKPTSAMKKEAAAAGMYEGLNNVRVPRLQIVTIETLLAGGNPRQPNGVQLPPAALDPATDRTVKRARMHDKDSLFQRHSRKQ